VRTVGYVLIDYCKKPLSEVYEEIEAYAGWAKDYETSGLGVGGILLDETPNHYTPERAEYLDAVHRHVKATEGLQGNRLVSCLSRGGGFPLSGCQLFPCSMTLTYFCGVRLSTTQEPLLILAWQTLDPTCSSIVRSLTSGTSARKCRSV
jgi:Spherulation-specific family 4